MREPVEFRFTLTGTGWAESRIAVGDAWAGPTASYLSDALGDLLHAVRELAEGAEEVRATWDEEPGEFRWIFRRNGQSVHLLILAFPEWRAIVDSPDTNGTVLLDADCALVDLIGAVVAGTRKVLDEHGVEGYNVKWVEHPFPADDLRALERSLSEIEAG